MDGGWWLVRRWAGWLRREQCGACIAEPNTRVIRVAEGSQQSGWPGKSSLESDARVDAGQSQAVVASLPHSHLPIAFCVCPSSLFSLALVQPPQFQRLTAVIQTRYACHGQSPARKSRATP